MNYEQLDKLDELRKKGVITEDEFQAEKAKILQSGHEERELGDVKQLFWGMDENTYCMFIHLATFANCIVPFGGLILQLVMWLTNKDKSAAIDEHGKIVMNWILSLFIYIVICIALVFVIIGIPMLLLLLLCDIIFAIIGAIKASNGVAWKYPMSIRFF